MDKATLSIELSTLVFGSFCFVLGNLAMTLFSSSKNSNDGDSKMKPSNQATSVSNTELSTELLARVTELQKEASENRLLFTVLLTKLADMERRENESFATLASKMVNSEDLIMDVKREVVILKKSSQVCIYAYHVLLLTIRN